MKKINFIMLVIVCAFMASCGMNNTIVGNSNVNQTTVQLAKKNFKLLQMVTGQESATYIFGIGGFSTQELNGTAQAKMFKSANLTGSQTIVNIVSEEQISMVFPIYYTKTITVNGQVVEFTE